jgi:hypothetical protein
MLKRIDDLGVFELNELLPDPFLLLDGHGSYFDLSFLEYTNNALHRWWMFFVAPYGTNLWQVGDLTQQNGSFNIEMSKEKTERLIDKVNRKQQNCHCRARLGATELCAT